MSPHVLLLGLAALGFLVLSSRDADADDPRVLFDEAVQIELHGGAVAAETAFALYKRAAEAGLPEAEFNAAIMLDSGRGVTRDIAQAATWYARAASHGHERAAYNLGQLYQTGDGVPANADLARAWFSVSNLPAALARLASIAGSLPIGSRMRPPSLVSPPTGDRLTTDQAGVELVWTWDQFSEPAQFLIEIRAIDGSGMHEVFSGITQVSSLFVVLPETRGDFAWRVTAIAPKAANYAASVWGRFGFVSQPQLSSQ